MPDKTARIYLIKKLIDKDKDSIGKNKVIFTEKDYDVIAELTD